MRKHACKCVPGYYRGLRSLHALSTTTAAWDEGKRGHYQQQQQQLLQLQILLPSLFSSYLRTSSLIWYKLKALVFCSSRKEPWELRKSARAHKATVYTSVLNHRYRAKETLCKDY